MGSSPRLQRLRRGGSLFDVEFIGLDGVMVGVVDQFEFHGLVASGTEERVAAKALEKELFKGYAGKDAEAPGAGRYFGGKYFGKLLADFLIADIAVESIVTDALEALWEDLLNHVLDKAKVGQGRIFNLAGTMVFMPVPHRFPVIVLDASHGDGRRDGIFGQILGEPPSAAGLFLFRQRPRTLLGIVPMTCRSPAVVTRHRICFDRVWLLTATNRANRPSVYALGFPFRHR